MSEGSDSKAPAPAPASFSRRRVLALGGAATAAALSGRSWAFALSAGHKVVVVPAAADAAWQPVFFSPAQTEAVALLAEHILPRTETPGARDARVHEYIDLVLSIEEKRVQKQFLDGLDWLEKRCQKLYGTKLEQARPEQQIELLRSISDEHEEQPRELEKGARFFAELKRRTVYGYYTSREGWVEELGRPEAITIETWRGCDHEGAHG